MISVESEWLAYHAFIVRLLQQRLDPAVVSLQSSQAMEVSQHTGNHAGHTGNRFQEDEPNELDKLAAIRKGCVSRTYPLRLSQRRLSSHCCCGILLVVFLCLSQASGLVHPPSNQALDIYKLQQIGGPSYLHVRTRYQANLSLTFSGRRCSGTTDSISVSPQPWWGHAGGV